MLAEVDNRGMKKRGIKRSRRLFCSFRSLFALFGSDVFPLCLLGGARLPGQPETRSVLLYEFRDFGFIPDYFRGERGDRGEGGKVGSMTCKDVYDKYTVVCRRGRLVKVHSHDTQIVILACHSESRLHSIVHGKDKNNKGHDTCYTISTLEGVRVCVCSAARSSPEKRLSPPRKRWDSPPRYVDGGPAVEGEVNRQRDEQLDYSGRRVQAGYEPGEGRRHASRRPAFTLVNGRLREKKKGTVRGGDERHRIPKQKPLQGIIER